MTIAPANAAFRGSVTHFASARRGSSPGAVSAAVRSSGRAFMNCPVRGCVTPTGFLFWFWSGCVTRSVVGPAFASLRSSFTRLKYAAK